MSSTALSTDAAGRPHGGHLPTHEAGSLDKAKTAIKYMLDPKTGPQPARLRTRTFLRSLRYIAIFAFWRLVRYAKYAAVGAIAAAVGGTVIGSVASGAAFVIAPTGIIGGAGMGIVWAVAKFGWRRTRGRMRKGEHDVHADPRKDEVRPTDMLLLRCDIC